jgi:hypothetical protein
VFVSRDVPPLPWPLVHPLHDAGEVRCMDAGAGGRLLRHTLIFQS